MNKQDRWSALSMQERANFIKLLYKKHSISDLEEIRNIYNSFGDGGRMLDGTEEEQTLSGKKPNIFNKLIKQYLFGDISDDEVRRRLYHNVEPHNYKFYDGESSVKRVKDAVKKNESEYDKLMEGYNSFSSSRDDIYAEYLQIPKSERHTIEGKTIVSDARYSPTKGTSENLKKINLDEEDITNLVDSGLQLKHGENKVDTPLSYYFADHTVGRGFDNKGDYVSYYDLWDLNPYKGKYAHLIGTSNLVPKKIKEIEDLSLGIGNPTEYYDRIYLDDYFDIPEEARGAPFITPAVVTAKKTNGGKLNKFETGGPTENNWEIPFSLESTISTVPITKYDYYTLAPEAVQIPIRDIKQKYAMAPELIALDEEAQIAELKERAAKEYSFGNSSNVLDDIGNQEKVNKRMLVNIYYNNQPDNYKYTNSSEVDTSPKIKITAPNTDISKFIYGNNISEEAIKEIKQVASKRNLDPYDILAHMLIESSGSRNGVTRNTYFNTHDVLKRQISPRLLDPNNVDIETLLRNLGVYNESKQYTNEEIRDYILDYGKQLKEAISNIEYPSSTIDAVGLRISKFGRDFNPAQKGFKTWVGEVVKNSYLDMIDSAITSLKENMPDLFK